MCNYIYIYSDIYVYTYIYKYLYVYITDAAEGCQQDSERSDSESVSTSSVSTSDVSDISSDHSVCDGGHPGMNMYICIYTYTYACI